MSFRFVWTTHTLIAAMFIAGCTSMSANWNARIGNFTYAAAVEELGSPSTEEKSSDGQTIAEWSLRHRMSSSASDMDGAFYNGAASFKDLPTDFQVSKLRLTFDTNNVLANWSKE